MPSLEELIDAEGPYEVGILDSTTYCKMSIIVAVSPDGTVTPLCMADDWEKSLPARLIAEMVAHKHTRQELTSTEQRASVFEHDFKLALERANRVAWLESEVSRLTADLDRFRQQEAAQRTSVEVSPGVRVGMYEVAYQREADNANPPMCTLTNTVVSDGPCQCSWCCKVREAGTTMPATEWTQDGRRVNITIREQTNSHIANDAPIFLKLCQCDDCRELRALSGYQAAEIEGH